MLWALEIRQPETIADHLIGLGAALESEIVKEVPHKLVPTCWEKAATQFTRAVGARPLDQPAQEHPFDAAFQNSAAHEPVVDLDGTPAMRSRQDADQTVVAEAVC